MNLKKAKKMRQLARRLTAGKPAVAYVTRNGSVWVDHKTTRGIYRGMKKFNKRHEHGIL
jgi:hypothetical protein